MNFKTSANKNNILAIMTRAEAEQLFAESVFKDGKQEELVKIERWHIESEEGNLDGEGIKLWYDEDKNKLQVVDEIVYVPEIKDVKVNWGFSEEYLIDAFGILKTFSADLLFRSAKKLSPLWVEIKRAEDKQKSEDLVILIAPRLQN